MTIDEAIKTLQDEVDSGSEGTMFKLYDAQKLGIEALKREKERRHSIYWSGAALLPGETEE